MKLIRLALITLSALALSACNLTLAEDITPPPGYVRPTPQAALGLLYPAAAPDLANGAAIYAEKCAPCHGVAGMGDGPQGLQLPASVTALGLPEIGRTAVPADWYQVVTQGRMEKLMPPFSSLDDQERWDVVAYALSLSITPEQVEQGRILFETNCPACSTAPFTDGQRMAAISQASLVQLVKDGDSGLPAFGSQLTDDELWSVAAYLRTLSFTAPQAAAPLPAGTPGLSAETPAQSIPEAEPAASPEASPASEEITGVFSGKVLNGSGGALPSGLQVTLHGYDHDNNSSFSEEFTQDVPVGPDGVFRFTDVPIPANRAYIAVLEYGGVEYASSLAFVDGTQTSFDLPITFYESTLDTNALSVDRWHIFLSFDRLGVVQVIEVLVISNSENQAVIAASDAQPALAFRLPENAANLQFEDGQLGDGRYIQTQDGFGDLAPILPGIGEFQAVFAYDLPYERSLELSRPVDLPVESTVVMVPEGVRVRSDLLQPGEPREFQGTNLATYDSQPLPVGATLTMTVSGKPGALGFSLSNLTNQQRILAAVGGIGLLLILAGTFLFWRDRVHAAREAEEDDELQDSDSLLDAIITLDDMHKAGKLASEVYQQRRAELKERLKEIMSAE